MVLFFLELHDLCPPWPMLLSLWPLCAPQVLTLQATFLVIPQDYVSWTSLVQRQSSRLEPLWSFQSPLLPSQPGCLLFAASLLLAGPPEDSAKSSNQITSLLRNLLRLLVSCWTDSGLLSWPGLCRPCQDHFLPRKVLLRYSLFQQFWSSYGISQGCLDGCDTCSVAQSLEALPVWFNSLL